MAVVSYEVTNAKPETRRCVFSPRPEDGRQFLFPGLQFSEFTKLPANYAKGQFIDRGFQPVREKEVIIHEKAKKEE